MQLETALGLAAFVGTAAVGGAWLLVRSRPPAGLGALRAWAAARGHRVRGDGLDGPFEVIGERGGRLFTVAWHRGEPDVLWLAVDCDAAGDAELEGAARLSDGALVSRLVGPPAAACADPDALLDALAAAAADLELRVTARIPPE